MQCLEHEPGGLEFDSMSVTLRTGVTCYGDLSALPAWLLHSLLPAVADTRCHLCRTVCGVAVVQDGSAADIAVQVMC